MTDKERYDKYIKEQCKNCKNRTNNLCEIKIIQTEDKIITRCCYYESNLQKKRNKKPSTWQSW